MRHVRLGRTGLQVSRICLGTMTFGLQCDEPTAVAILDRAAAGGVTFLDAADVYPVGGSLDTVGRTEEILGRWLAGRRHGFVIATKCAGVMGAKPWERGLSRKHIFDAIDASLRRLRTDYVDLYQLHSPDRETPIDETLRALDDLTRQGLVRYIGVSNWSAWKIAKALGLSEAKGYARFETLQAYYSIAGRDLERDLVPMLSEEKLGLMVWSPLAGGLLSGKFGPGSNNPEGSRRTTFDFPPVDKDRAWKCVEVMREVGDAHGVTVARVALAYILQKAFTMSIIIGAKTLEQLDDNLAAAELTLTDDEMKRLDEVSDLPSEYPGWMFARQGGNRRPKPFVKAG